MKQGYFVTDDGMVAVQGLRNISEAKAAAEAIIKGLTFGEIGCFEILHFDGTSTKTHQRFEAVIDWERIR